MDKSTSIEQLMSKKNNAPQQAPTPPPPQQKHKMPPRKPEHYQNTHANHQAPPIQDNRNSFQVIPENKSFIDKIKSDKYIMDLLLVGATTFIVTNNMFISTLKTKVPSIAAGDGTITLQGNVVLALVSIVVMYMLRKLI